MLEEEKRNYNSGCNYHCCVDTDDLVCKPEFDMPSKEEPQRDCMREEMIMKIRELDFAIIELALYLDTHPDDRKALCLHREYAKEVKELKDKYQKVYGPLTINYPCNKWRWLEEPWPSFNLGYKLLIYKL